jgi:outer membrane biosynthesis protein TonB
VSAYENGRSAIASPPSQELARAGVPAYNRRQDLTLAYGLKPPPPAPEESKPEPVRVSSFVTTPPHPVDPSAHPAPAPRHTHRPRPHALSKPRKPDPAPAPRPVSPETTPATPTKRSNLWMAVVAAMSLAGVVGASLWAVDARARSQTCAAMRTLISASAAGTGGPAPADLRLTESALRSGIRRLMFHGDLKDAASGLATDIGRLGESSDLATMLAVVASINDHGRATQQGCGLPEKDLFEVTNG